MLTRMPQPGDVLEHVANSKEVANDGADPVWELLGTVVGQYEWNTNIVEYRYADEERQARFWKDYEENPVFIAYFSRTGEWNNRVRIKEESNAGIPE